MINILVPGLHWHHRVVTAWSQTQLMLSEHKISHRLSCAYSTDIYHLRNSMAYNALKNKADTIVWIDTDVVWTADQFRQLINLVESYPVVTGWYRDSEGKATVGRFNDSCKRYSIEEIESWENPVEIEWGPSGFMAIKADIYKNLPAPWYRYRTTDEITIGEDISFCRHLQEHGIPIYLDPKLKVLHRKAYFI